VKTTLLIDADIVAYRIASANEKRINWGVDEETGEEIQSHIFNEDFEDVKRQVRDTLDELMADTKADEYLICLSDDNANWRKKVLPSYKQHRKDSIRPEWLYPLKDHLAADYPAYRRPTLEADDVMGILSTHPKLIAGRKIIVSEDKDMKTIPGWLYNPKKDRKPWLVTPEEADWWHMYQTIIGDTTDGYTGCPGSGPKEAEEMLKAPFRWIAYEHTLKGGPRKGQEEIRWKKEPTDNLWEGIVSLYLKAGLTERDAVTQARVARICRHTDYNFTDKEVIYWNPPK
jgi:5'-3' exonuclease